MIVGNAAFTPANGVTGSGNGSLLNPYTIRDLNLTNGSGAAISISNTTAYFVIQNVFIFSSSYAIVFFNVTNGEVSNSTLYQNNHGILLLYSNDTDVFNNNFVRNSVQANDTGTLPKNNYNSWDNGYGGGGNYWSDYKWADNCSGYNQNLCPNPDGIGDKPYQIPGDSASADIYPLMRPYYPDTTPPFWPSGSKLIASHVTFTSLALNWTLATDDIGVVSYRIFEGQTLIGNVTANKSSFNVTSLKPATSYTFRVQAGDRADNWSDGTSLSVTTPSKPPWYLTAAFWIANWYLFAIAGIVLVSAIVIIPRLKKGKNTASPPNQLIDQKHGGNQDLIGSGDNSSLV